MVTFGIIPRELAREAYQWHRGFAGNYEYIFPRVWEDYLRLVEERQAWCVWDERRDFLGSSYFVFDEEHRSWEIGGIMVVKAERKTGMAGILGRLVVGHVLIAESPLKNKDRVIAHVHAENQSPLGLLTGALKFTKPSGDPQEFDGSKLPGLKQNEKGKVPGFELSITIPDTINAIADWCDGFEGKLKDNRPVELLLPTDLDLKAWARALRSMVSSGGAGPKPTLRRIR